MSSTAPSEGIYLIELHSGAIKLGRSKKLTTRLREHAANLDHYGGRAISVWTYTVPDSRLAESTIRRMFAGHENAEPANASREVWTGISMPEAIMTAVAVLRTPGLFKLKEPVGAIGLPLKGKTFVIDLQRVLTDTQARSIHSYELLNLLQERDPEQYEDWDTRVLGAQVRKILNINTRQVRVDKTVRTGFVRVDLVKAIERELQCSDGSRS